ncbi:MAG: thioredoxin-dependent thiol peroxidase [Pseudomonadota bacterium]
MAITAEAGAPAPDFNMPTTAGGDRTLGDYKGRKLVLYFYPKDDTPGCTKEAIAFTEQADAFDAAGISILGVSRDPLTKHEKFRTKHDLGIDLGADEDGKVCEDYGVWVEKKMYGKTYMGIERATFLIDENGQISKVWRKVKVPDHAEAVFEAATNGA